MRDTRSLLVLGSMLFLMPSGCAAPVSSDADEASQASTGEGAPEPAEVSAPPSTGAGAEAPTPPTSSGTTPGSSAKAPCAEGCTSSGDFELRLRGAGFVDLVGKKVGVSAVEPTLTIPTVHVPVAVLTDQVKADGSFELVCPKALVENYVYPSVGAWLDVSGDGKCGAGDLAVVDQRYGWTEAMSVEVTPNGLSTPPTTMWWTPPETAKNWGVPFCEYYGFPR